MSRKQAKGEYIETDTGNKVARKAVLVGTQHIMLGGKTVIQAEAMIRGDLARTAQPASTPGAAPGSNTAVAIGRLPRPFRRHRRISSVSSTPAGPTDDDVPSLSNSPTDSVPSSSAGCSPSSPSSSSSPPPSARSWSSHGNDGVLCASTKQCDAPQLTRLQPNTIRCSTCGTDFAFHSQIVSKGFTGHYGRAWLVSPIGKPPQRSGADLINITVGKSETRLLATGSHVVADIQCATCRARVGWKYLDAKEESQKYKIGMFILETRRTVSHRDWDDVTTQWSSELGYEPKRADDGDDPALLAFDSDDSDDCEDVFTGVFNAKIAARRRRLKLTRQWR
ncbi:hypothetical protein NUW58_g5453 [Xylaria curta]|uniref:Uncharacterized protein n=1 Tax=Xylaria curta TaxID=42375 RepID=A0ACC1P1G9_9PEZI|nr:hypothetical protein NUW58_g5453 [Xylaria curta]